MVTAPLGDDVFQDDPTVLALQERAAALLGKEAGLFVPSGTMANQLALRAHTVAGDEVIAHAGCHIVNYEGGGGAALAGVHLRTVTSPDGTLPMDQVQANIHQTDDPHFAPTTLIAFENTHNGCGGCVVDPSNVEAVTELAKSRGIGRHLDGARLFNAAVASERDPSHMARSFDTVSICLSKGLGAPVGSVLVGTRALVAKAYRFRKMYGGGMRQAGVLAAAGLYALDNHVTRLADDHSRARALAESLNHMPGLVVDLERVHTNLVYLDIDPAHPLATPDADGAPALVGRLREAGVWITGGAHRMRAVMHLDVNDADLERAIDAFRDLMTGAG